MRSFSDLAQLFDKKKEKPKPDEPPTAARRLPSSLPMARIVPCRGRWNASVFWPTTQPRLCCLGLTAATSADYISRLTNLLRIIGRSRDSLASAADCFPRKNAQLCQG